MWQQSTWRKNIPLTNGIISLPWSKKKAFDEHLRKGTLIPHLAAHFSFKVHWNLVQFFSHNRLSPSKWFFFQFDSKINLETKKKGVLVKKTNFLSLVQCFLDQPFLSQTRNCSWYAPPNLSLGSVITLPMWWWSLLPSSKPVTGIIWWSKMMTGSGTHFQYREWCPGCFMINQSIDFTNVQAQGSL